MRKLLLESYFSARKLRGWVQYGILLSIVWTALASTFYFVETNFHGAVLVPTESVDKIYTVYSTRYDFLHDLFNWDTKEFSTWTVEVDPEGLDRVGQAWKVCILKPTFNLSGYLKLILMPILITWLMVLGINIFIWPYRRETAAEVARRFETTDPVVKFFVGLGIIASYPILWFLGLPDVPTLIIVALGLAGWFLIKKAAYGLVYVVTKAIKDAKRQSQ